MSTLVEKKFIDCCNEYANSKLILSNQALTKLLRLIASENQLYAVLETCAKGFKFKEEFENAKINTGTGYVFRLPQSKRALVALVASILYSFDNGSISVLDFIEKFYPTPEGVKDGFPVMCKSLIIPFRDAVISVMRGEEEKAAEVEAEDLNYQPVAVIPEGLVVNGGMVLRSMAKLVMEDGEIDKDDKQIYLEILDGAVHALEIKDLKIIKAFYRVLHVIMPDVHGAKAKLKELDSCFRLYLIL